MIGKERLLGPNSFRYTLLISAIAIAAVIFASPQGLVQEAHALPILSFINGSTCEPDFGGTWDSGTSTCTLPGFTIDNGDGVEISAGVTVILPAGETIYVNDGTLFVGGTLNVGGELVVDGLGTLEVNSGGTLNVNGLFDFGFGGILNVNDGGTLNVNSGGTIFVGGDTPGVVNVNDGGTLNVNPGGELDIGPDATLNVLSGGTLVTLGSGVVDAEESTINVSDGGSFGGTLNLSNDAPMTINAVLTTDTLTITGGSEVDGTIDVNNGGTINLMGTVEVLDSLNVNDGGTLNVNGLFDFGFGGILNVNDGGTLNVNSGGTIFVGGDTPGVVNVNDGGTLNVNPGGELDIGPDGQVMIFCGGTFNNNGGTVDGTITYEDCEPPVITILGPNPATVLLNLPYTDAGATVTDDTDPSPTLTVDNPVNTAIAGTYTVTYTAEDDAGNDSTATRTVHVIKSSTATKNLIDNIKNQVTDKNVKSSLLGPLKEVQKILDDKNPSNDGSACGKLSEFIANVNSKEASGKLSSTLAQQYKDAANAIKSSIGC